MIPVSLTMMDLQRNQLQAHLFPGDGNEAAAIGLCARRAGDLRHRLLLREVHPVPYSQCAVRTPVSLTWSTDILAPLIERAEAEGLSIVKFHSHPNGYRSFSGADDASDGDLFPLLHGAVEKDVPHASVVMLPGGEMFGRSWWGGAFEPLLMINVIGDDLQFWPAALKSGSKAEFMASTAQIFDEGTIHRLRGLWVAVVGCSGTGSPVIEQLFRLGVGVIVLVDDDKAEHRNLNRIINSTTKDADERRLKVDLIGDAINRAGLGTRVIRVPRNLWHPETVRAVGQCDIVIGCMDTVDGRFLLNLLSTYYLQPYIDIGVRLDAVPDGPDKGRIREVCGSVHYLQPGKSSLLTRGLFTLDDVAAAGLRRRDPAAHDRQAKEGYIKGVVGHRPAVISVNMFAASLAVTELLARLHPFREEPNAAHGTTTFSFSSMELMNEMEEGSCPVMNAHVGKGDVRPLLRLPELGGGA